MDGNVLCFGWEVSFMEWLQSFGGPVLLAFFEFITELGGEYVIVAILGFIYWGFDKNMGKALLTRLSIVLVYPAIVKNLVKRLRPYFVNDGIKCLHAASSGDIMSVQDQGYSFPSMHSANSAAFYGYISIYVNKHKGKIKWITALGILLPLLIGISRIYVGVHYPTDVIAGWIFGIVSILLIGYLEKRIDKRIIHILILVFAIPGFFICRSNDFFTCYGLIAGAFLAFWFEEKYVNFENTSKIIKVIVRVVAGLLLFLAVNSIFKLPFSEKFLESGSTACLLFRSFRYFVASFLSLGVYPLLFAVVDKKWLPTNR